MRAKVACERVVWVCVKGHGVCARVVCERVVCDKDGG